MKKHIYIFLSVSLLLAGCKDREEPSAGVSETEIRFAGVADTRAAEALPADYSMWVSALHYASGHSSPSFFFNPEYQFAYDASSGYWRGANGSAYYPAAGTMDFLVYACGNASVKPNATYTTGIIDTDYKCYTGLTLEFGSKLNGTVPVMVSDLKSGGCGSASTVVPLKFRHLLSKVIFTMRTLDETTSKRLKVYDIKLKNVYPSGTATVTPHFTTIINGTSESGSEIAWTSLCASPVDFSYDNMSTGVKPLLTSASDPVGAQFGVDSYFPPQSGSSLTVELTYSLLNTDDLSSETPKYTTSFPINCGHWVPGGQYTYTLTCTLKEICITGSSLIDGWTEVLIDSEQIELENLNP